MTVEAESIIADFKFENRSLTYSRTPLAITPEEWRQLGELASCVWASTDSVLKKWAADRSLPVWVRDSYAEAVPRIQEDLARDSDDGYIDYMRLDLAWDTKGRPRVLELNTACPAGWVLASQAFDLGLGENTENSLAPGVDTFTDYLSSRLGNRIAFITMGSDLSAELDSFATILQRRGIEVSIIDPLLEGNTAVHRFAPSGLYWKTKPFRIIENWTQAQQLMSQYLSIANVTAMQVTEDKRFLEHLSETPAGVHVAETLGVQGGACAEVKRRGWEDIVVKPSNSTRGIGVKFHSMSELGPNSLTEMSPASVIQPRYSMRRAADGYGDLALYILRGQLVGAIARVSNSQVVNVGAGGGLQPILRLTSGRVVNADRLPSQPSALAPSP